MHFVENLKFLLQNRFHPEDGIAGISEIRLNQLISGKMDPTPSELISLVDYFNISIERLLRYNLNLRPGAQSIKLVVFDIDGVLTDGGMYYSESGDEYKKFNSKDGLAIRRLEKEGYITGVISHGINVNLISRRAKLLNIPHVYVGNRPKEDVLREWCRDLQVNPDEVAYIGDDINDLPVMQMAGFTACPSDAVPEVKSKVDVVLGLPGGKGCVREWIDNYILGR